MNFEIVPFIRDIAIIVMAIMVIILSVIMTVMLLRLFPAVRRIVRNFETASNLTLNAAARISGMVQLGSELGNLVWGLIQRIRRRQDRDEEETGTQ